MMLLNFKACWTHRVNTRAAVGAEGARGGLQSTLGCSSPAWSILSFTQLLSLCSHRDFTAKHSHGGLRPCFASGHGFQLSQVTCKADSAMSTFPEWQ